jgi:AraC-like DNA-binding protein/ribosomal protein S27E
MWDNVSPVKSQPSQLYHLAPIGLGTPFVESLSSYILRLAEAHHVLPNRLAWFVRDSVNEKSHFQSLTLQNAYALNSNSGLAQRWVSALEALTLRRGLASLTMLPWVDLFAPTGLMHRRLAWCSDCFREWREAGTPLSIPLLWLVSAVSVCPRHHKQLETQCPVCGHKQPVFSGTCWLGYCIHCGRLLDTGRSAETASNQSPEGDSWEQALWTSHSLGALLAAVPDPDMAMDESPIMRFAQQCVTQLGRGNLRKTAGILGISPCILFEWQRGRSNRANVNTFFSVCFRSGIAPLATILRKRLTVQPTEPEPSDDVETQRPKRPGWRIQLDKERLTRDLDDLIAHDEQPPPTIHEVAGRLGCSKDTLYRHFSKQYRILLQRHRTYRAAQLQTKREKAAQALEQALTEWPPPTTAQIAKRVGYATGALFKYFYPQFQAISARSQAYKEAQVLERIEHLRRALEEELDRAAWPPPTTTEILAGLPCTYKFAYKHCADLCHALSARHLAYRRFKKQKGIQARQAEVHRVVQEIHAEGLYPSRNLVDQRLSKYSMMLHPEAREAYRQTLRDLGYQNT